MRAFHQLLDSLGLRSAWLQLLRDWRSRGVPQGRSLAIGTGIASSLTLVALLLLCRRCRGSRPRTERKKRSSAAKRQAGLAVFGLNPSSCGEEDAEGIRAAIDRGWLDGGHVVLIADVKMKEDQERIREIARNSGLAEEIPAHRMLFCKDSDGKVSILRMLEPWLYVDRDYSACSQASKYSIRARYLDAKSSILSIVESIHLSDEQHSDRKND